MANSARGRDYYREHRVKVLSQKRQRKALLGETAPIAAEDLEACRTDIRKAKSVRSPDWIVCLECGELLNRVSAQHLVHHGLTAATYKAKWGYNRRSGLASVKLSARRSSLARKHGLARIGLPFRKPFPRGHRGWRSLNREATLNRAAARTHKSRAWRWKSEKREASDFGIAEARLRGETHDSIARRAGLSSTAVYWRLSRMGFPGRPCVFEHGGPMKGQAILDLLEAFDVTVLALTVSLGVSRNALYPHMRRPHKTIPPDLARAIQRQRLLFQRRAPTLKGGRPSALLPADQRALPAKYRALHDDLDRLRHWLREGVARATREEIERWFCEQTRARTLRTLLFWPGFFSWVRKFTTSDRFAGATWRPQEMAFQFLAHDYGVTERAVAKVIFGS